MNEKDSESYIDICPPTEFDFSECLVFLGRSEHEVLHQVRDGCLYKLVNINDEMILLKIRSSLGSILVELPMGPSSESARVEVVSYIREWFDLDQNLNNFYNAVSQDMVLGQLVHKYYGLRMICIPDLFEALTWAIMGQQINLTFAYTLKKRFTEHFGECLSFKGETHWLYPTHEKIAALDVEDLRKLQFTVRKAEYIIGIAKAMAHGEINKQLLLQKQDYEKIKQSLMDIRGIGAWTADYVMMKCLHHSGAFPLADVGLHNALKIQMGLDRKPTIEEIKEMAAHWEGWQAYATFYLWRSLYE
ncbi:DNA-3-methyladenine glycosylase 2 [Paenibacillus sp. N3/727]|uniref:DNA-3-methyladenine glycosylase family protein n=1 Tax=Paenibacillus sp. N3/727 TaxID=2925845 RepID=UPI001F534594|nr:DNA-3-methyladenine glycosylase 2 [Paenibacillus sp. N3/727]UNK18320.1 DNA-3-methyladenine glycosylase 2 [Paenibacillus sp. N3/727]